MTAEIIASPISMSSREIAELTGKKHFHVVRDIRKQFEKLGIGVSKFGYSYKNSQGKEQPEYRLDHIQTMNLITGYDVVLRDKVNRRWMELEFEDKRESVKTVWWEMQDAIEYFYEDPKSYDHANEQNLIYRVVFGMTAKQIKKQRGLGPDDPAKDGMTASELTTVEALEAANALFLRSNMDYVQRKLALKNLHTSRLKRLN